jgi:FKBP-type peptidyl-prolyl cis-trans isomerase FkpA
VVGMQEGGRRRLMVPSELGYGAGGAADIVPPNADLIYDIELIEVR